MIMDKNKAPKDFERDSCEQSRGWKRGLKDGMWSAVI